jgi:flagellar biosynthetic protein FliP
MTSTTAPHTQPRSSTRAFLIHLGEMLAAMFAGMVVLGAVVAGVLALAGTSLGDAPTAVEVGVMGTDMTIGMAAWMRYRGHPLRHNVEMALSMLIPTALAIVLYWLGAIADDAALAVQHAVMIPAMVGVMLWRRDHYADR